MAGAYVSLNRFWHDEDPDISVNANAKYKNVEVRLGSSGLYIQLEAEAAIELGKKLLEAGQAVWAAEVGEQILTEGVAHEEVPGLSEMAAV